MHSITKATGSAESAATAEGSATDLGVEDSSRIVKADEVDEGINHAARVSLAQPQGFEEEADLGGPPSTDEGASLQHLKGKALPKHHVQGQISAGYAQGHSAADDHATDVDGGSGLSRRDDIPVCTAQDFFKGRG